MTVPKVKLSNGLEIPAIGFGSGTKWKRPPGEKEERELIDAVVSAINAGHLHIDTAEFYGTEKQIGEAIKESGVPRKDIFLTSKTLFGLLADDPIESISNQLKTLQTDYFDLFLIHVPPNDDINYDLAKAWGVLEQLYEKGLAKAIGVSNHSPAELETIIKVAKIKPHVNQIEFHPLLQEPTPGIVDFCKQHDIVVEGYSPLASNELEGEKPLDAVVANVAKNHNVSPGSVLLRWATQKGIVPITTSANAGRQKEALAIFDFKLSDGEVEEISKVGAESPRYQRLPIPSHKHYYPAEEGEAKI
ncbi:NADP-dependent oxidoreductase domain-containing protein [Yarrowia lipolytica]|jgi:diketogulonate reductase-like aldo/keto reductase|uniref:YALI0B15268p n=2 Tax=Yarrowia lipolytica TaxID=4952 RepID=Q6CEJ0_YARLI|nr:YALI0B15268p [Yarrowia lipolytica CLIB122]AOW01735.1 hypothetical protein YALI1_B20108g [Yarrowia lipolytica]KAB8284976.1 NADP-dependent oxidoreductase domain-containing protein [Yarrowia lipolytica]KAE8175100.1 NADP-dependent oxidoreductase domain-containing protein [Yarrowia lipolytica]KAJ8052532.1 NADP-dependent oxidoreductase domain-containing protein [Yarrowia lipolytica]QNP96778.1 NADPH-dependent alpha-keto amide reductase [Yarrowia lipolytica]|eukprot:XP_500922.1 YALI0B15268p [Yarrowia lipolytica CLIB122]